MLRKKVVITLYCYSDLSIKNIAQQAGMSSDEVQRITDEQAKSEVPQSFVGMGGATKIEKIMSHNVASLDHGGPGNDNITGGIGIDRLYGGQGNDTLVGGTFADLIVGGEGDDKIISNDDLTGQRNHNDGSQDIIFCGPGHDEVWFSMHDGDTTMDCEIAHSRFYVDQVIPFLR